jgi:hypothetical protein
MSLSARAGPRLGRLLRHTIRLFGSGWRFAGRRDPPTPSYVRRNRRGSQRQPRLGAADLFDRQVTCDLRSSVGVAVGLTLAWHAVLFALAELVGGVSEWWFPDLGSALVNAGGREEPDTTVHIMLQPGGIRTNGHRQLPIIYRISCGSFRECPTWAILRPVSRLIVSAMAQSPAASEAGVRRTGRKKRQREVAQGSAHHQAVGARFDGDAVVAYPYTSNSPGTGSKSAELT